MFKRIFILTMMQLGEKLDMGVVKDKKRLLLAFLYKLLSIGLITAVIFVLLYVMSGMLLSIPLNTTFFTFIVAILQVMSIVFAITGLTNSMYLASDNQLLFSYPAKHNEVFLSKVMVFFIYELLRNITFLLPFFISFGLLSDVTIWTGYWPMSILMVFILSLLPVLIGVIISIPVMLLVKWLKEKPGLATLLAFMAAGGIFYGLLLFVSSIPHSIRFTAMYDTIYSKLMDAMNNIYNLSLYCQNITRMFFGYVVFNNLLIILAIILILLVLAYLISRPIYFKMAVGAYEFSTKKRKIRTNEKERKPLFTYVAKEFKVLFRSSDQLLGNFVFLLLLPIILFLLNRLIASFDMREIGQYMLLSFNILLGLLVLLSSNTASATALSKEGDKFYLLKVTPVSMRNQAIAKITFNVLISFVTITITSISIAYATDLTRWEMTLIYSLFVIVNMAHIFWSIDIDLMNPEFKLYATNENVKENKNIQKSTGIAILISVIVAILLFVFFIMNDVDNYYVLAWVKLLSFALVFLAARIYLFFTRLDVYFKRIEF